ncbi:Bug family tripartite tricarboxylate transporter substrate binding protein [Comamonas composti]|uniref:Bug family tripartite tricarboxylate transporter substrate binding protein n=1 Tax=Comamonas composti TaxID=408558 RepID=UPI000401568F|nr:tripartite tricarboxylate transporter substrate binding protein [Comamonas composti]
MTALSRRRLLNQALAHTLGGALLPLAASTRAQGHGQPYPSRPIKWLVPYLAATAPDIAARILAEAVGPLLGQPMIIENRAGAAGNIGTRVAAKAAPDGYTLLYTGTPLAANMHIYKSPGYDALKDFRHIMQLSSSDVGLVVHADSGIHTLDDLLRRLRAAPGEVDYASGGIGTPSHLGMELFLSMSKARAMHVPYKGASELVNAVLSRQVSFGMPIFSVAHPMVMAGKLRLLAVASARRNPMAPETPTLAELGIAGAELTSWGGLSVPAGTPDAVVDTIYKAFAQALQQPKVIAALQENGGLVDVRDAAFFTQSIRQEMQLTEAMMKKVGLQPI